MVAITQHFGHFKAFKGDGACVLWVFKQPGAEGVFDSAGHFAQHAGYEARDGVHNDECGKFATGEHIVADGEFFVDPAKDAFVEAFVVPADEDKVLLAMGIFLRRCFA